MQHYSFVFNLKYLLFLIIIIYTSLNINLFKEINKQLLVILLFFISFFVLFPLVGYFRAYESQILINCFLSFIYILFLYFTSHTVKSKDILDSVINILFFSVLAFLIIVYIIYGNDLFNFGNISNAFNLDNRLRQTYGLKHANTLGNLCFVYFLVSFYKKTYIKQKPILLRLYYFFDVIVFFMLLNSGSRTSLTSIAIFFTVYLLSRYVFFYNKKQTFISFIFGFLILTLLIILYINIQDYIDKDEILKNTNRYYGWLQTYNYIKNTHFYTGLGYVNISYFYNNSFTIPLITDNWFLYIFVTLGVMGILGITIILLLIIYNFAIYNKKYIDSKFPFYLSLFFSVLYYSSFEVVFFMPSELLSYLFWILIFNYLEIINSNIKE